MQGYSKGKCKENSPKDTQTQSFNHWVAMHQLSIRDNKSKPTTYEESKADLWENMKPENCEFKHFESKPSNTCGGSFKATSQRGFVQTLPTYEEFEKICRKEYDEKQLEKKFSCECNENKCCVPCQPAPRYNGIPKTMTGLESAEFRAKLDEGTQTPPQSFDDLPATITGREGAPDPTPEPKEEPCFGIFQSYLDAQTALTGAISFTKECELNENCEIDPDNNTRIIVNSPGIYQVFYEVSAVTVGSDYKFLFLLDNGIPITPSSIKIDVGISSGFYLLKIFAGDYLSLATSAMVTLDKGTDADLMINKILSF